MPHAPTAGAPVCAGRGPARAYGSIKRTPEIDLYKWVYKLAPVTPLGAGGGLPGARGERPRAGHVGEPCDLTALSYEPVRIKSPSGRAEYATAQTRFAA